MFGKFFRKKHQQRLVNDNETLESYAVRINAAKIRAKGHDELCNELDLLQKDLHYSVPSGQKVAVKDLHHITSEVDKILKMLSGDQWNEESIKNKIQTVRADLSMHGAHNIK